jgi:hypothetical protein
MTFERPGVLAAGPADPMGARPGGSGGTVRDRFGAAVGTVAAADHAGEPADRSIAAMW